jgi:hypothetical protein
MCATPWSGACSAAATGSFPAKGPSGGRTLLAQNAVQLELGRAHHVGQVPPDQTAATDPATKAVPSLSGVTSSRNAVNHLLKSVVREICTLRLVGTGGGRPPPVTRWCPVMGIPTAIAPKPNEIAMSRRDRRTGCQKGVSGPSRCTTEPDRFKCLNDSAHLWMKMGQVRSLGATADHARGIRIIVE